MTKPLDLCGQLLVAMPGMDDPYFAETVAYVTAHNARGAMALLINRPLDLSVRDLLAHLGIAATLASPELLSQPVYMGGPVGVDQALILHHTQDPWLDAWSVADDIWVSGSKDALVALAQTEQVCSGLVALGYAGWSAGQLEEEVLQNMWLTVPNPPKSLLFETPPHERPRAAARLLGIADMGQLDYQVGHA